MSRDVQNKWSNELLLRIDAVCCRFEELLKAGANPSTEEYLEGFDGWERNELQAELLALYSEWIKPNDATSTDVTSCRITNNGQSIVPSRYEIMEELGRGTMGVVYKARDTHLNRIVAIKTIIAGKQSMDSSHTRFRKEAEAVATISHANIVQIFDTGEFDGNPYIVLEFISGGTLGNRMGQNQISPTDAAAIIEPLARALYDLHNCGIIHRDLKPANIMFSAEGVPKITDFGLVKRLDTDSAQTKSGDFLGTPAYMSPEQAMGHAKDVGPSSDIYALGAILYECLTGRPPFRGSTILETVRQILADDPIPPHRLKADVPYGLEAVCLKCLEKNPIHRYVNSKDLADDLNNFLSGKPTDRPTSFLRRIESDIYSKNIALAEREWAAGRCQNSLAFLEACPTAIRGWEWHCLKNIGSGPLVLNGHLDVVYGVAFSPDGSIIASVSDDQTIRLWKTLTGDLLKIFTGHTSQLYTPRFTIDGKNLVTACQSGMVIIWDLENGKFQELAGHTDVVVGIALSPDGRLIASASDDTTVRLWDLCTRKQVQILQGHTDMVNGVAFSPDSKTIASVSHDETVRIWDVLSGRELHRLCKHNGFCWTAAFSPDGKLLASAGADGLVRLWNVETGEVHIALSGHSGRVWSLAFTPDGTRLASAGWDKTVRIWDFTSGLEMLVFRLHLDSVNAIAFSSDGARLVSASDDRTLSVWVADPNHQHSQTQVRTLRNHDGSVLTVAFSPDGKQIASAGDDRIARIWDIKKESVVFTLTGHTALVAGIAFSPTGELLATVSADKTVRLWETGSGKLMKILRGHSDRIYSLAFSPNGQLLATTGWDRSIRIWEVATGDVVKVLQGHTNWIWAVAFTSDGKKVVTGSTDRTVRIWEIQDGRETMRLNGHGLKVLSVAVSPNGKWIASSGGDGVAKLWDAQSGAELESFTGHTDRVTAVTFEPSGKLLATSSEDQTIRLWDLETAKTVHIYRGHYSIINALAFSPTEATLASGSDDSTVFLWNLEEM